MQGEREGGRREERTGTDGSREAENYLSNLIDVLKHDFCARVSYHKSRRRKILNSLYFFILCFLKLCFFNNLFTLS